MKLALQKEKLERKKLQSKVKSLEAELQRMQCELHTTGVEVDANFSSDIQTIMKNNIDNASLFMKMFWQEQKKSLEIDVSKKYHPMVIRLCLS